MLPDRIQPSTDNSLNLRTGPCVPAVKGQIHILFGLSSSGRCFVKGLSGSLALSPSMAMCCVHLLPAIWPDVLLYKLNKYNMVRCLLTFQLMFIRFLLPLCDNRIGRASKIKLKNYKRERHIWSRENLTGKGQ